MTTTATPLNTPMLRSQTSSVLVPTWISTLGGGASTATNSTTASSAPPPPPPAYTGAGATSTSGGASNNNSMTRSPFFGGVGGASQGGGRAAALSAGLASWRNAGPARASPGTSPSLGPASSPGGAPPPPPPSYSATVTTVSGTSNQSKRATMFCEIADQVYTRIVNEAAASSAPTVENSTDAEQKERDTMIAAAKASEVGKFLNVIRIAGLGDNGKDKVSSAVTVACQTQLSEPSGRFYVFELAPVGSELWPSHISGHSTPTTENEATKPAKKTNKKQQQQNGVEDPNGDSLSLPTASNEELWNKSRVVCIACPNSTLCKSLVSKLEDVFCATEEQKKKIFIEVVRRSLPVSCCLVVKASNSANKNHEAEIVPWGELMEAGAQVPESYDEDENNNNEEEENNTLENKNGMLNAASTDSSSKPPPSRNTPETAKPGSSSAFPSVPSSGAPATSSNKGLPSYEDTISPLPPSNLGPAGNSKNGAEPDSTEDSTNGDSTTKQLKRVPAPVIPSYFRLLRNERGVFRNALFLRFPSQAKAEIAMMYLERLNLSGRRIRIEHKKQSRSYAQQQQLGHQQPTPAVIGVSNGSIAGGISPSLSANAIALPPSSTSQQQGNNNANAPTYSANSPQAQVAASGGHGAITNAVTPAATHHDIMESNINDLIRRYDRDGFSYPKRLLSAADTKFLSELAAAHELLFETGTTTVTVTRPRKGAAGSGGGTSGAAPPGYSAAGSAGTGKQQSPGLGSQTPPWAPQTPPLAPKYGASSSTSYTAPGGALGLKDDALNLNANQSAIPSSSSNALGNGSFSERAASGTMTFRGLRHWKEQRAAQQTNAAAASSNNGDGSATTTSPNDESPSNLALDGASPKYVRCLDWQEAQRKGIAAWSSGRGKPVVAGK